MMSQGQWCHLDRASRQGHSTFCRPAPCVALPDTPHGTPSQKSDLRLQRKICHGRGAQGQSRSPAWCFNDRARTPPGRAVGENHV
eukprot:515400-Prymnesium_polylepis.1